MKQQDVHVFVFDDLADWEMAYAVTGINNPQFQIAPHRYRIRTVSLQDRPILSMGGIRIVPDLTLDQLSPHDSAMLILPGGMPWAFGQNTEAVEVARRFLDAGIPVAAICAATLALARAGLLDHRRHTSNAPEYLAESQYRGASLYEDAPAVTDDKLITAPGTAAIDFARHIFQQLNLYSPAILDAWYGLHKTGKPEYFTALIQAANA
ncbi:type 1 glutamine amidotransferase family protein [Niveibacterium terrae]|uniref:type 1 glutamine amidotransferase family protein n=1 Tax=Niveibacterium terrae TaxID=3373598 RepID=UPI003A92B643